MIDIEIPPEVLDAMEKPLTYPAGTRVRAINAMRLAAALAAWPGASLCPIPHWPGPGQEITQRQSIILPLPQEERT